jgi:hypothetical protein
MDQKSTSVHTNIQKSVGYTENFIHITKNQTPKHFTNPVLQLIYNNPQSNLINKYISQFQFLHLLRIIMYMY